MLDQAELRHLTRWCAANRLSWQAARTDAGGPALLLMPAVGRRAATDMPSMLLFATEDDELHLTDAPGTPLATASDLHALLDALDSGLTRPPIAGPQIAGRSPTIWNNPGSPIT